MYISDSEFEFNYFNTDDFQEINNTWGSVKFEESNTNDLNIKKLEISKHLMLDSYSNTCNESREK